MHLTLLVIISSITCILSLELIIVIAVFVTVSLIQLRLHLDCNISHCYNVLHYLFTLTKDADTKTLGLHCHYVSHVLDNNVNF